MPTVLDDYLSQIGDADLRAKIQSEFDKTTKDFGLVFERHQQEGIKMPKAEVSLGSKVILNSADTFHTVVGIEGDTVTLSDRAGDLRDEPATAVTVAREFGDVMYPGLTPVDEIRNGKPGDPVHTVINGENYHALEMLQYTHAGKIDLIYVDPPYNTGNKTWKYNDRYVAEKDSYRHSKWLSFMEKRLLLARKLLTPTGVIIVAIGDDEHHRLRMLMDQVFGGGNFLSNITWQGRSANDRRFTGGAADYMLVYALSREALTDSGARWVEAKPEAELLVCIARNEFDRILGHGLSAEAASKSAQDKVREFFKSASREAIQRADKDLKKPDRGQIAAGLVLYNKVDIEGRLYRDGPIDFPGGGGPRYEVLHPNGKPAKIPSRGWGASEETLQRWIRDGEISFGVDESTIPQRKLILAEKSFQVPPPTFYGDRDIGTKWLGAILNDRRFPFPKDHSVLMRWFRMVAPENAIIIDFFGGSGTTAEAVMRLNAEDGGTRQAILVTNNELAAADDKKLRADGFTPGDPEYEALGVFHHVTRPRISTVVTGIRPDGSKYSDGLAANVAFFDLEYLDRARVKYGHEFDSLAGVFWLRAGARGPLVKRETLAQGFAFDPEAGIAVLFRPGRASALAAAISEAESGALTHVFIVTDSDEQGNVAASYFDKSLTIERIYGSYLSAFQVNKKD